MSGLVGHAHTASPTTPAIEEKSNQLTLFFFPSSIDSQELSPFDKNRKKKKARKDRNHLQIEVNVSGFPFSIVCENEIRKRN
ncbi:hypothetical protein, partial [Escherichia coli]|uniref:hypothetical protein n=1 Tax=Escherichia coli TaxID=562 RepID=UPI001AA1155D